MLDDYELIYLAKENNEDAIEELIKKYYGLICYKANKNSISREDSEELINEETLSLYEAINNYNDNENTKFITYLNACIDKKISNYKKLQLRKKFSILNTATALDENIMISGINNNPIDFLIDEESYKIKRNKILNKLNYKEELVFILREQNFTVKEISKIIDIKLVEIYNLIKSIRIKINRIV